MFLMSVPGVATRNFLNESNLSTLGLLEPVDEISEVIMNIL